MNRSEATDLPLIGDFFCVTLVILTALGRHTPIQQN